MHKSRINVIVETFQMNRFFLLPSHVDVFVLPVRTFQLAYSNFEILLKNFKYQKLIFEHRHTLKFENTSSLRIGP